MQPSGVSSGFTQTLALEVGKYNITANTVCPGPTESPMVEQVIRDASRIKGVSPEEFKQTFYIDLTPLGRLTRPLDVAKAVTFLASDDAEFITGASVNVSGGRDMHSITCRMALRHQRFVNNRGRKVALGDASAWSLSHTRSRRSQSWFCAAIGV